MLRGFGVGIASDPARKRGGEMACVDESVGVQGESD